MTRWLWRYRFMTVGKPQTDTAVCEGHASLNEAIQCLAELSGAAMDSLNRRTDLRITFERVKKGDA